MGRDLDHPVLFVHLKFRLVEPGIEPHLLSDSAISLRRALWKMGERRFPRLVHRTAGDADPDRADECLRHSMDPNRTPHILLASAAASALACAEHAHNIVAAGKRPQHPSEHPPERATERVAVLMTPTEKAAYADRANSLGLSLGQFFREAGAAYAGPNTRSLAEAEALEAALKQLELSTSRTERTLDAALAEVRAALSAQR